MATTTSSRRVNFNFGQSDSNHVSSEGGRESLDNTVSLFTENSCLYPLENLLQEITRQEKQLWERTHGIHIPIEDGGSQLGIEEELMSVGGVSIPSHGSVIGTEPSATYLIRYGQLTKVVHRYFRKLEKEHACLYLSGRRANFDNLRLHPDPTHSRGTPIPTSGGTTPVHTARRDMHSLRDEELLVYRCAIMCAQFPMLSAPSPPDDRSPSPPFPPVISGTAPSESSVVMATLTSTTLAQQVSKIESSLAQDSDVTPPPPNTESNDPTDSSQQDSNPGATDSDHAHLLKNQDDPENEKEQLVHQKPKPTSSSDPKKPRSRRARSFVEEDSESESEELIGIIANKGAPYMDPLGREQPFPPMVNREMLCSLVRHSFHQTEEQQIQFEQILRHEHGRKSKGEILARELVAQMQILESNAHPFYKPRNFVTRNGYDIWLQAEKQRLRDQLDKFWHFNLPKPQSWSRSYPVDYHKAYMTLLEKIISCESRSTRREPVHGGRTPSSPLSPTAQRLLTEFGLRYGVGELYQRIVYLDYLAKHFDYEIWYICHCTDELKAIRSLIPRNRAKMTATRREMELLRNTVHLLHGQTDNSLTRIDRLFQESDPQAGVASLIELLKEVLEAEQSLFSQRIRPIDEWLKRYLTSGFVLRYERKKEIVSDEIINAQNAVGFELSPILINALLHGIREEVSYYRDLYQVVFRKYFNIVPFAKKEFYRLTCADACSLCARLIHDPVSRQRLNLEMLGLLYRLNERDIEWSNDIPTEMQQWRNQFVHLALIWMDVLAKQINQWILLALREDQWTVLTFAVQPRAHSPSPVNFPVTAAEQQQQVPQLQASQLRISPFSSNLSTSPFSNLTQHSRSAFTAVEPASGRRFLSPMSELSGSISEITASHSSIESLSQEIRRDASKGSKRGGGGGDGDTKSKSSGSDSFLQFGKDPSHSSADEVTLAPDTVPDPSLVPREDNMTPQISPILPMKDDEYEDNGQSSHLLISATVHHSAGEVLENGFSSSPSPPLPIAVPPSYKRFSSFQGESIRRDSRGKLPEEKLLSKSFDNLTNKPGRLPPQPPQISVVPTHSSQIKPLPVSPVGCDPTSTTSLSSSDPPESPSIRPLPIAPSPSLSATSEAILYFFPVSNSPVDLVTMYIRLASFIGGLLKILTPKIRQGLAPSGLDQTTELPSEVNQFRRLMADIKQQTETMRIEFLKKIHKIMVNSLKLYADNLLCMDLCYLPQNEAKELVGEEMIHHLKRRNETGEIWGCRHLVEANHGLHPDGLPCLQKVQPPFESITRDMCIRINNIHVILAVFPSLESHIYTVTLSPSNHTPFGPNLSSEASGSGAVQLDGAHPRHIKTRQPFPHRYQPEAKKQQPLELLPQENGSSDNASSTVGVTPLSRRKQETGFQSTEAQQFKEYMENVQRQQLLMICLRMNRFFQPALTLLLKLKLGDCPISRRLEPVVSFLTRHVNALSKHLYPECYQTLLKLLWRTILQDIEEEALKLRTEKSSIYESHLLLQTVTHLIKIIHNEGQGLSLDILTTSTEYLLALLDIFLKPTNKLIKAFDKLTGPQFTHDGTHIQLDQSPVPLTPTILHQLSSRLHTYRKCFTGQEFVDGLIKLGNENESLIVSAAANLEERPSVAYTVTSALQLGQYLLDEGILICLLNYDNDGATPLESSSNERMDAVDTSRHTTVAPPPTTPTEMRSGSSSSSYSPTPPLPQPPQFRNRTDCWFKFTDFEDSITGTFFHRSRILSVCSRPPTTGGQNALNYSEFDQARFGTIYLLLDVLQQRSRKDKQAKQFLQQQKVILTSQQRIGNNISCLKIFHI